MVKVGKVSESNRDFDLIFWKKVGQEGILNAMLQMAADQYKWGKHHGRNPPRLRRHVAVFKHR